MKGQIAGKAPIGVVLEEGKTYAWCACGLSSKQPFCDGSHTATDLKPHIYIAEKAETKYFCVCKQTDGSPFCDGTHKKLD